MASRRRLTVKKVRITVMRTARYDDLIEQYENPVGQSRIA